VRIHEHDGKISDVVGEARIGFLVAQEAFLLAFLNGTSDLRFGFRNVFVFLEDEGTLHHEKGIAVTDAKWVSDATGTFSQGKEMDGIEQICFSDPVFAHNAIDV